MVRSLIGTVLTLLCVSSAAVLAQETTYIQTENIVYHEVHGIGLVMDVFVPKGEKNGLGVIDVISGSWFSDRGKIRDHTRSQTFQILCRKGYTVFAIRPGSITKFSAVEMRSHLNHGIRWVKDHAGQYGIDPERLGLMGASAGGHLACLTAVTAEDGKPVDGKTSETGDTRVKAVAVFFPPTDFLNWKRGADEPAPSDRERQTPEQRRKRQLRLAFAEPPENPTEEVVNQALTKISPARLVTSSAPPFLLIHGDRDPLVPLQQSEIMIEALKKAGVSAELIVKKGGGHPWLTMHEEVQVIADWFDVQLKAK